MRTFSRIERLPPYVFNITGELKMVARWRGEDIIDMSMANPDGATPQHIVDKLVEASSRPTTHGYSVSKGIPRLRKAICDWYQRRYAVEFDPDSEAIVTIGSKEGLAHLMLATLDRGDTVLVPNPSYPIHIYGAVIAGANIRSVRMTPGVDFFEELERAVHESIPKPKMMVFGFPSNPTAQCVDLSFFERVVALAKEHDILVVHDIAYGDITFDGYVAPSIMQVPGARDVAVEFFTMSKSYNMAGWRVGYMVGNRELVNALCVSRVTMTTARSRLSRWRRSPSWMAPRIACLKLSSNIAAAGMCWRADCTRRVGMWKFRRRPCISGRRSPSLTGRWVLWNLPSVSWRMRRSPYPRGSASASMATSMFTSLLSKTSRAPDKRCAASKICSARTDCLNELNEGWSAGLGRGWRRYVERSGS
jgi:histidinol-phosphate/aromatic aminotransferase/cobyric acid decarboxylase-like protein